MLKIADTVKLFEKYFNCKFFLKPPSVKQTFPYL